MDCVRNILCLTKKDCAVCGCVLSNHLIIDEAEQLHAEMLNIEPKHRLAFLIDVMQEKQPPKVRKSHLSRYWGAKYLEGIDLDKDPVTKRRRKSHTHKPHIPSKKSYRAKNNNVSTTPINKVGYKKSTVLSRSAEKGRDQAIASASFVNYMGMDCPCVGFIDRGFSLNGVAGVRKYQNAYYHSEEQKYVFEVFGGILAYPKEKVEKFIKPFFPDAKDVSLSVNNNTSIVKTDEINKEYLLYIQHQTPEQFRIAKQHGWKIARSLTQPQINFHE